MRDCVCFHVWVFFLLLRGGEVTRRVKIEAFRMWVCESGSNVKMLVFPSRISSWSFCSPSPDHTDWFQLLLTSDFTFPLAAGPVFAMFSIFFFAVLARQLKDGDVCQTVHPVLVHPAIASGPESQAIVVKIYLCDRGHPFNDTLCHQLFMMCCVFARDSALVISLPWNISILWSCAIYMGMENNIKICKNMQTGKKCQLSVNIR